MLFLFLNLDKPFTLYELYDSYNFSSLDKALSPNEEKWNDWYPWLFIFNFFSLQFELCMFEFNS